MSPSPSGQTSRLAQISGLEKAHCPERMGEVETATGFKCSWAKLLKRTGSSQSRWHDLRPHVASRLVQRRAPLSTVRDLLEHSTAQVSPSRTDFRNR